RLVEIFRRPQGQLVRKIDLAPAPSLQGQGEQALGHLACVIAGHHRRTRYPKADLSRDVHVCLSCNLRYRSSIPIRSNQDSTGSKQGCAPDAMNPSGQRSCPQPVQNAIMRRDRRPPPAAIAREESMPRAALTACVVAGALAAFLVQAAHGQTPAPALSGTVASDREGAMEGVLVSAHRAGSTITVTVVSDARGEFTFP